MRRRIGSWVRANMPTRESMEANRWLRPVAHRVLLPELWRFNRRSVPRGVALGLLVGVLVPVAQTVFAALLSLPARANVPVAALTTFVTNPLTTPPIWLAAYWIGTRLLGLGSGSGDATGAAAVAAGTRPETMGWLHWMLAEAGPATLLGLVVIAVVSAAIGHVLAAWCWRGWIAHRWRQRSLDRAMRGL